MAVSSRASTNIGLTAPTRTDDAPVGETIGTASAAPGPRRIPAERYTSAAFADRETERLWPHVWQMACSADHLLEVGDYFEYRCGILSVLIVRSDDGGLQAFQNVCMHRGNELCSGTGSGLSEIRCPYHRWSWDLSGRLREVPSRRGFGGVSNDDYGLIPVAVDTWGGLVFVHLDVDAAAQEPLSQWVAPVAADSDWAQLHEFTCTYAISVPLPCNWKVAIEGFSETYHVQGIHREMLPMVDDVNSPQEIWERHGKMYQPYGMPSPRLRNGATDQEVWEAFVDIMSKRAGVASGDEPGPHPELAEGEVIRDAIARRVRAASADGGVDLDPYTDAQVMDLNQYNLFPNITVLVMADLFQVVRSRPGDGPDHCFLDAFTFDRMGTGPSVRSKPVDVTVGPDQADLGMVLNQDLSNLQRTQRGLYQPGFTHVTLSAEECRIANLHKNLEEWLDL